MSETQVRIDSPATDLTVAIVEKIAERENTDPVDLTPPLHSVIDTEALDSLFDSLSNGHNNGEGSIQFTYRGYNVTVNTDRRISISE